MKKLTSVCTELEMRLKLNDDVKNRWKMAVKTHPSLNVIPLCSHLCLWIPGEDRAVVGSH